MNKKQIQKFRELNFPDKDSRKQWSIVSGVSARAIRSYESGQNPVPKWYTNLIIWWCELNDKPIHGGNLAGWVQELISDQNHPENDGNSNIWHK